MMDAMYEKFPWLRGLRVMAEALVTDLHEKERNYEGSWQKRGGIGAFMMLARKWDRIEAISARNGYDLFEALRKDDSGIVDDIDDLISYLMLARCHPSSVPADGEGIVHASVVHGAGSTLATKRDGMEHPFGYDEEDELLPSTTIRDPMGEAAGVIQTDKAERSQDAEPPTAPDTPPEPVQRRHALPGHTVAEGHVRIQQMDTGAWADIPDYVWMSGADAYERDGWVVKISSSSRVSAGGN